MCIRTLRHSFHAEVPLLCGHYVECSVVRKCFMNDTYLAGGLHLLHQTKIHTTHFDTENSSVQLKNLPQLARPDE